MSGLLSGRGGRDFKGQPPDGSVPKLPTKPSDEIVSEHEESSTSNPVLRS